jgi:hypothetical protein
MSPDTQKTYMILKKEDSGTLTYIGVTKADDEEAALRLYFAGLPDQTQRFGNFMVIDFEGVRELSAEPEVTITKIKPLDPTEPYPPSE